MTFAELQKQLQGIRSRRTVIGHLIEYLDENFMPLNGGDPKNVLLTEDKIRVSDVELDDVVTELNVRLKALMDAEGTLLNSSVTLTPAPEPDVVEEKPTEVSE